VDASWLVLNPTVPSFVPVSVLRWVRPGWRVVANSAPKSGDTSLADFDAGGCFPQPPEAGRESRRL
jgi:hypothetical protein